MQSATGQTLLESVQARTSIWLGDCLRVWAFGFNVVVFVSNLTIAHYVRPSAASDGPTHRQYELLVLNRACLTVMPTECHLQKPPASACLPSNETPTITQTHSRKRKFRFGSTTTLKCVWRAELLLSSSISASVIRSQRLLGLR